MKDTRTENQKIYGKGKKGRSAEVCVEVFELYKRGLPFRQIGKHLGISKSMAHKHVKNTLEELKSHNLDLGKSYLSIELERLDDLLSTVYPMALSGDLAAVDRVLKIQERRSKFLGFDQPPKQESESGMSFAELVLDATKKRHEREEEENQVD